MFIDTFTLNNFEGPLEFLLALIQKEELDIEQISIQELTQQLINKLILNQESFIDKGAEWIHHTSYLIWLKSRALLPKEMGEPVTVEAEEDPHFDIIYHLIDYCQFKKTAKHLSERQEQQSQLFFRGSPPLPEGKKPLGIQHLSLEELSTLFGEVMKKMAVKPTIQEEDWKVSDKIRWIKHTLEQSSILDFHTLFEHVNSRLECIVIFLAILELMKIGTLQVIQDIDQTIRIIQHAT